MLSDTTTNQTTDQTELRQLQEARSAAVRLLSLLDAAIAARLRCPQSEASREPERE
jgi:hypothetical protein